MGEKKTAKPEKRLQATKYVANFTTFLSKPM